VTKGLRPNGGWQVADFGEVELGFSQTLYKTLRAWGFSCNQPTKD